MVSKNEAQFTYFVLGVGFQAYCQMVDVFVLQV